MVNVSITKDGREERSEKSQLLSKLSRLSKHKLRKGCIAFAICIAAGEHAIALFQYPLYLICNSAESSYFRYWSSHLVH